MIPLTKALKSTVGQKYLMAASGIALVLFTITHLAGNLTLYSPDSSIFNTYAKKLHDLGPILIVAELGLLAVAILHIVLAVVIKRKNRQARPEAYKTLVTKGGPSKSTVGSRNMILTGIVLLVFLIIHIKSFKYGPGMDAGYVADIGGEQARDLYRLVHETFKNPFFVLFYVGSMLFLGFHIRHGFWSAFQSLGANNPRVSQGLYALALVIALLLAIGFLFIPVSIYFDLPSRFGGGSMS